MAGIQTSIKLNDHFSQALSSLNKALSAAINSFETVNKVSDINTDSIQKARSELAKSNMALQNMESSLNNSNNSQQKLNKSLKDGSSAAQSLWDKIKGIAAAYLTFQGVKSVISAGDTYIGNKARIDLMNDGLQTTVELQQKIYEASQRSLTGYTAMTDIVAKLGITASQAFKNNDEMIAFGELMQKQFAIAGTGTQEKNAAMYQLTQAMASGRLQGDEFRSILENAPLLAKTISDYMGLTLGQLREASSEGKITSDIIKNALFSTADETNKKFANMPMSWGDLWVQATNKVNKGLEPLFRKLQTLWNSQKFQNFMNVLVNGFLAIANFGVAAFDMITSAVSVLYENWSLLEPIIWSLVSALGVYFAVQTAGLIKSIVQWGIATWAAISYQWALFKMTVAQYGFNAALAMCPLTWFLYAVIAIIGAFYLLIAIINKVAGTSISATGLIAGAFRWLGALIANIFIGAYNIISGIVQAVVNAWKWAGENMGTIFKNIGIFWSNLWVSAEVLFYKFINAIVSGLEMLATPITALAKLFGMDLGGAFDNMHAGIDKKISEAEAQKKEYGKVSEFKAIDWKTQDYLDLGEQFDKGYDWGKNFKPMEAIKDSLTPSMTSSFDAGISGNNPGLGNIGSAMKNANMPMLDKLDEIANNTGATNATLSKNNEDMSYLRDLAEREAINSISNQTIKVDMTNNNNVNSKVDLDEMVDYLQEKVYNTMITSAEGTHV